MSKSIESGWFCEECDQEISWGEKVVLISGGEMNIEDEVPSVDKEPWWYVCHKECYEKQFHGEDH